jgi:lysozyme
MTNLIKSIVENEGFSPVAYPDPITKGEPYTFGHGLTTITESESLAIVQNRIASIRSQLSIKLSYYTTLPDDVRDVLDEMAYQMGVGDDKKGLLSFKNTLAMVQKRDFLGASKNMMLSKWAKQTPERALKLSRKMGLAQ